MGKFSGKKCRLLSMLWLTTFFFFVEIIVGYITNSMSLVADSFHMLSDVAALVVAFLSVKMSPKKWSKNTFGWARAEVLGALVNAVFLVALCFSITVEACKRFIEYETIHEPKLLVIVGVIGFAVNIVGVFLFHEHGSAHGHGHSHGGVIDASSNDASTTPNLSRSLNRLTQLAVTTNDHDLINENEDDEEHSKQRKNKNKKGHGHSASQMNMRGVFLHVLFDAIGSIIVIISALVYWLTDWEYKNYIDPALSVFLVLLILYSVWPLLRDSALILLQTVPTHIQVDAIQRRLLAKVDGVLAVHEFHVWQLAGDRIIASAHIRCRNLSEYMKIAEKVKEFFHNEGIHSTTIQPEFIEYKEYSSSSTNGPDKDGVLTHGTASYNLMMNGEDDNCVLDCPKSSNSNSNECVLNTCCGPSKQGPSPGDTPYLCRQRNSSSLSQASINNALHSQNHHNQQQQQQRCSLMDDHQQQQREQEDEEEQMEKGALI